jgi:hypothetical protein
VPSRPILLVVADAPERGDESPEADAIMIRAGLTWIARQEAETGGAA